VGGGEIGMTGKNVSQYQEEVIVRTVKKVPFAGEKGRKDS